jgi:hypothetical protein
VFSRAAHDRHALLGVFWTHQAGEPANVRRYYRITAALVVLLVVILLGFASWLAGSKLSK